jgi:hypothetical protein
MARVVDISEFLSFDYTKLRDNSSTYGSFVSLFDHPIVPITSVSVYLLISPAIVAWIRDKFALKPKGFMVQLITISHSFILAIYSMWTFYNTFNIIVPHMMKHGVYVALCDVDQQLWRGKDLGFWITHFYISKYYEFIDTW